MGKTSNEVKRRYNSKTYKRFSADLKIDLLERIDKELKARSMSKAEFLRIAAEHILEIKG